MTSLKQSRGQAQDEDNAGSQAALAAVETTNLLRSAEIGNSAYL